MPPATPPARQSSHTRFSAIRVAAILALAFATTPAAMGQNGAWTTTSGGTHSWDTATNWNGSTIASGTGNTASFTANIVGTQTVTLDSARTIGNITFTDSTTSSHDLTISGPSTLMLDRTAGVPIIDVTQAGRLLTISSVIAGNDGLQKNGAGTLVFSSTSNNTFTGGFNINDGVVQYDSATNANAWGDASNVITFTGNATLQNTNNAYTLARAVTINNGVTATFRGAFNESTNVTGVVSGSGTLSMLGDSNNWILTLSNTANTFAGAINIVASTAATLNVSSLGSHASNSITLGNGGNAGIFTYNGSAALSRPFVMGGTTGGTTINASGSGVLTASSFSVTGAGAKTLTLDGSSTATNRIAGNIVNNGGNTSLTKTGAGTWALGGTNTYSGVTNLAASGTTGRLVFQGSQSLSPNTTIAFNQNSSAVQSISLLDDGVGTINFARPITFVGANTTQVMNIFVGNNNIANLGSSLATTTGSVIQVGDITWNNATQAANTTRTFNLTGANDYSLLTGNFVLPNLSTRTAGQMWTNVLNPTTASLTIGGNITMAAGNNVNGGIPVLQLGGTASGNSVLGSISDAADVGTTNRPLSVVKAGTSDWTLSGNNTYTGSTTLTAGTLSVGTSANLGAASSNLIFNGGTLRITGTALTNFSGIGHTVTFNATTAVGLDINDAGHTFTVDQVLNQTTGGFNKSGAGRVILSQTNTYSGATSINAGVLQAASGTGLPTNSILQLRGGVFQSSGTFTRTVGTAAGNVNWSTSSGGFAANGGTLNLQLNNGTGSQTWNGSSFVATGQTLIFGSTSADNRVDFQNALNLGSSGSGQRTIQVIDNPNSASDIARISGQITNTVAGWGINKTGDGVLELTGNNTYSGNTTVSAGTLLVNNTNPSQSGTGSGSVTVASSATLGGTGFITGPVTIQSGGTLSPGNSPGTLTVDDNVTIENGGQFLWEVGEGSPVGSLSPIAFGGSDMGLSKDLLAITGGNSFTMQDGSIFAVREDGEAGGFTLSTSNYYSFTVSTSTGTPTIGNVTIDTTNSSAFTDYLAGGGSLSLVTNGGNVYLNAAPAPVPEPASVGLIATGALGICALVRRYRRQSGSAATADASSVAV